MEKITITNEELRNVFNKIRDEKIELANKLDKEGFLNKVYRIIVNSVKEEVVNQLFKESEVKSYGTKNIDFRK